MFHLPISLVCTHEMLHQHICTLIRRFGPAGSFNFMHTLDSMSAEELEQSQWFIIIKCSLKFPRWCVCNVFSEDFGSFQDCHIFSRCFGSLVRTPVNRVSLAFIESTCSGFVLSGGLVKCTSGILSKISCFRYGLYLG